jgi:AcrR family transcriptional regulator
MVKNHLTDRSKVGGRVETRAAILKAAEELFGERGYSSVSARDVAQRAGVNKALVFYHFETMEHLFEEVLDRYYEAQGAALAGAFEGEGSFQERVVRLLEAYMDFMDAHRLFPRLVQQEVSRKGPAVEKIRTNMAVLLEWAERALGDVLPKKGPVSARHFYLTLGGMVIQYYAYAPALVGAWGADPLGAEARSERREHLRWVVAAILEKLEREAKPRRARRAPRR